MFAASYILEQSPRAKNPMSQAHAIVMEKIRKDYAGRRILDGLDLRIEKGEIVFLKGENGSGKTSLLKIAAALSRPAAGKAQVAGFDTVSSPEQVRRRVGFVSHEDCLYESLSAFENLRFFCELQRIENAGARAGELIEIFEIPSASRQGCGLLSAGMKKRISIARAVSHNPEVLLLDEPFSGLDRRGSEILSQTLERLKNSGAAALVSTHGNFEGADISDWTAVISDGRADRRGSGL
ncbi:ABC transporter ATP-binding protein [Candidatus Mycalebacterium sp.]